MNLVSLTKNESFVKDSDELEIKPNQKYEIAVETICKKGWPYSAYFTVIILDQYGKEIIRFIRWLNDFSNIVKKNSLVFSTPTNSKTAIIGFRINVETPVKSDFEIELPEASSLKIKQIENESDSFDDFGKYEIPKLPDLSSEEEDQLGKKTIWLFGTPRSGTTWLGSQLLNHPENIIWFEPWIGLHLGMLFGAEGSVGIPQAFDRVYDIQSSNGKYFFSPHHKKNWMPALKKFILTRIFSEAQTIQKNVIIKEPVGSHSADIIMECFPNSKLIFLIRDGRDVVDSRIDMHKKGSWGNLKPFETSQQRINAIKRYSYMWNKINERINCAYENHNPKLRIIIKYEDLKKDTLSELKKIYDFIEVKVSDEELMKKIEIHDFKNIPDSQKGEGKFYRAATTGGWRENFSKEEQELMNSIMGDTLKQMGYDA